MAAEDHLSGEQFQILHPHRLVQLGDRTYPAVHTMHEGPDEHSAETATAAWIPSENGALTRVAHFSHDSDEYHLAHSRSADTKQITVHGGQHDRESVRGMDALHERLDAASTRTLHPDEIKTNQARMKEFQSRSR
jgi:hypothetical protein